MASPYLIAAQMMMQQQSEGKKMAAERKMKHAELERQRKRDMMKLALESLGNPYQGLN